MANKSGGASEEDPHKSANLHFKSAARPGHEANRFACLRFPESSIRRALFGNGASEKPACIAHAKAPAGAGAFGTAEIYWLAQTSTGTGS